MALTSYNAHSRGRCDVLDHESSSVSLCSCSVPPRGLEPGLARPGPANGYRQASIQADRALPYLGNPPSLTPRRCHGRRLAPASSRASSSSSGSGSDPDSPPDETEQQQQQQKQQRALVPRGGSSRGSNKRGVKPPTTATSSNALLRSRAPPPQSTHPTGVPAHTFQAYLHQCSSYSSYLDEAFVLVGFRQPSYFRPDMSKAACIYIGWLLTAGILDCVRGPPQKRAAAVEDGGEDRESLVVAYPYYEYLAVRELQAFVDGAGRKGVEEVVYPVVTLGMFEVSILGLSIWSVTGKGVADVWCGCWCRCFGSAPAPSRTLPLSSGSSRPRVACTSCLASCRTSSSCESPFSLPKTYLTH